MHIIRVGKTEEAHGVPGAARVGPHPAPPTRHVGEGLAPVRNFLRIRFAYLGLCITCGVVPWQSTSPVLGQSTHAATSSGSSTTELFGIQATGSRIVYVIDVSASTAGAPLRVAKGALWSSIGRLQRTSQVQIVFYNQSARFLSLRGEAPRLYWADDNTKQSARRFIDRTKAAGGTNHVDALKVALQMQPDVIFLYTDAQDPQLSDEELARIRALNGSAVIHAIEFGHGQQPGSLPPESARQAGGNFLVRLAAQNGGEYRYVDVDRQRGSE